MSMFKNLPNKFESKHESNNLCQWTAPLECKQLMQPACTNIHYANDIGSFKIHFFIKQTCLHCLTRFLSLTFWVLGTTFLFLCKFGTPLRILLVQNTTRVVFCKRSMPLQFINRLNDKGQWKGHKCQNATLSVTRVRSTFWPLVMVCLVYHSRS